MNDRYSDLSDEALGERLRRDLPRPTAPASLRVAIVAATQRQSGITLARVFAGDDVLWLMSAEPVYLDRERGIALHYEDRDGRFLTYVALPAPKLKLPDRDRVQVDRFKPML